MSNATLSRQDRGVSPPILSHQRSASEAEVSEAIRLSLHESDPVTGDEDTLSALFYEYYRGYTIYSTEGGECCIHGAGRQGCLRLGGRYVSFPDIEEAKALIKYFRAHGYTAAEGMERAVPPGVYAWVNRQEGRYAPAFSRPMQRVS